MRRFSVSRKEPEYSIQLGHLGLRGLNALTYHQAQDIGRTWMNSTGAPPNPACHFTQMPDPVNCSVEFRNGHFVVQYGPMGLSAPLEDQESACNKLMASATAGECAITSPIGDAPCMHTGVSDSPRDISVPDKLHDGLETCETSGPIGIRLH